MALNRIRIATRKSPLALWQADYVKDRLLEIHENLTVELIPLNTQADKKINSTLANIGGKGLYTKELEDALLSHDADIAVHSMKDVTIKFPEGLGLPVILSRDDPGDVMISNKYNSLEDLPAGAKVGTSSLRRQCQLKAYNPRLEMVDLRGNVGTRLRKLDDNKFDAIILATAGVKRLKVADRIKQTIDYNIVLPAVGQGAIGIETRCNDEETKGLIADLNDPDTFILISAERAFSERLYGSCQLPVAAYAEFKNDEIFMQGMVGKIDGSEIIKGNITGLPDCNIQLGIELAEQLLEKGADKILKAILNE